MRNAVCSEGRAARRYLRKDARINIQLSDADLEMLKQPPTEEGLPHQRLSPASCTNTSAALRPRQISQPLWGRYIENGIGSQNTQE